MLMNQPRDGDARPPNHSGDILIHSLHDVVDEALRIVTHRIIHCLQKRTI